MTGIGPCLLHEITNCSVCTGLDKKNAKEEFEVPAFGSSIHARYAGKCPKCGESFPIGRAIFKTESDVWICCP